MQITKIRKVTSRYARSHTPSHNRICKFIYYMSILSVSAIHRGARILACVPYGTRSIRPILLYRFRGDAMLSMGPYGSAGTCIINYAPPEINVVVMEYRI